MVSTLVTVDIMTLMRLRAKPRRVSRLGFVITGIRARVLPRELAGGYWDRGYGTDAVTTLVDYIFRETNFNRIHLKTLDWNTRAQKCFQKCGFTPCGHSFRGKYSFILMEIYRDQWQKQQTET